MTRQLDITSAQREATDRANLYGVIYLLSGTFAGREGVPDAPFYWATRELTALGHDWRAYIASPQEVLRAMGFEPGAEPSFPEVRIPVRNLPFAHSESIVAAVTDEDFRVENTTATLRVAYLKPGQLAATLTSGDFTPLVLNGFLGPADEVTLDGLILPLYNRGARRNQAIVWPRLRTDKEMEAVSGGHGAIDTRDAGIMPPIVGGMPQDWVRVPTVNLGVRGQTVSGYSGGTTTLKFRTMTAGPEDLTGGNVPNDPENNFEQQKDLGATVWDDQLGGIGRWGSGTGRAGLQIHNVYPVYQVVSAAFDPDLKEFTVTLNSGLVTDIPRGAFVQQWGGGFNSAQLASGIQEGTFTLTGAFYPQGTFSLQSGLTADCPTLLTLGFAYFGGINGDTADNSRREWGDGWIWMAGAHQFTLNGTSPGGWFVNTGDSNKLTLSGAVPTNIRFGWLFADGTVRPADTSTWRLWPVAGLTQDEANLANGLGTMTPTAIYLSRGSYANPNAPVYYDPLDNPAEIATQPEFENEVVAFGVKNYGTGSSHTGTGPDDSANAWDGSWATNSLVDVDNSIIVTFNDAPAPYVDSDTTASILHIVARASTGAGVTVRNAALATLFTIPGGLGTAEPTEFTVAMGSTQNFDELLRFNSNAGGSARIVEAYWEHNLNTTVSATRTVDARLNTASGAVGPVMQFAELVMQCPRYGSQLHEYGNEAAQLTSESLSGVSYNVPTPAATLVGLHALLGPDENDVDGLPINVNIASYAEAHQRFLDENVRVGFVWTDKDHPQDWTELERTFNTQTRSFAFYGTSGHEIIFLEEGGGYDAYPVLQTFRLPGVPGSNVFGAAQPLFERTRTTELVNKLDVLWDLDHLDGTNYRQALSVQNEESVAAIGLQAGDRGPLTLSLFSPWEGNPAFDVATAVSGLAEFYVARQAFAATRFNFDTAWVAHGLDRGSLVRISYPVSNNPPSYRNVLAEVESVAVSPLDGERFSIRARSIGKPQKGIDPNYTWDDVFDLDDAWTSDILQEFDTWSDYWSTP